MSFSSVGTGERRIADGDARCVPAEKRTRPLERPEPRWSEKQTEREKLTVWLRGGNVKSAGHLEVMTGRSTTAC